MISCQRATELMSQSRDESLTLKQALELRLHLFICEFCKRFQDQLELIKHALHQQASSSGEDPDSAPTCAPEGAKQRLKARLSKEVDS